MDSELAAALRQALNHLYDPEQLRASPLVGLFGLEGQGASAKLQHILLAGIGALRPQAGEPPGSMPRRVHQVLQLRYEQQFAQKEVAVQMGLSVRQYRRLQQTAVEALALHLSERYGPEERVPGVPLREAAPRELPQALEWLRALAPGETTAVAQALPEILRLVEPLAARHGKTLATVEAQAEHEGPVLALHPLVFRQAMLHVLNAAILHTTGEVVRVRVEARAQTVAVSVCAPQAEGAAEAAGKSLQEAMVQQMLHACEAALCVQGAQATWEARLTCGRVQPQSLLIVDDHVETTDLLTRYVEGTRYRVVACHDPRRAMEMALAQRPLLVLLDVMMPEVDGWEVLMRLKQHEATAGLPVYVCTVLDQSELALSLGAEGFLRKPFTRQALLQVLEAAERARATREVALRPLAE
jgi:CheY-like chemotaxis protein